VVRTQRSTLFGLVEAEYCSVPCLDEHDFVATQAFQDACFEACVQILAYAASIGATPIMVGPFPCSAFMGTAANDALRLQANTRGYQWAKSNGSFFLDLDTLWAATNSSGVREYQPGYDGGDQIHYNDAAANAAAAAVLAPYIKAICG
jgi:hypothetical protein